MKKLQRWAWFSVYVDMNFLLIYLFTETGGAEWIARIVKPFTTGALGWAGEIPSAFATRLAVWSVLWSICYWLYRKKIFVKL